MSCPLRHRTPFVQVRDSAPTFARGRISPTAPTVKGEGVDLLGWVRSHPPGSGGANLKVQAG